MGSLPNTSVEKQVVTPSADDLFFCYDGDTVKRLVPLSLLAFLIVIIAIANAAALYWHLFYTIWWFDIIMHLVGGLWIALAAIAWFAHTPRRMLSADVLFVIALSSALGIGLAWELFEFSLDTFVTLNPHDLSDTLQDLVMDALGALAGWGYGIMRKHHKL